MSNFESMNMSEHLSDNSELSKEDIGAINQEISINRNLSYMLFGHLGK
jgi:hypothetical protein